LIPARSRSRLHARHLAQQRDLIDFDDFSISPRAVSLVSITLNFTMPIRRQAISNRFRAESLLLRDAEFTRLQISFRTTRELISLGRTSARRIECYRRVFFWRRLSRAACAQFIERQISRRYFSFRATR